MPLNIVVARVPLLCGCLHHVTIAIAIVGSRFGAAVLFQLHLEGRACHGDKDIDRGRVGVVDAAKGLLSETNKQIQRGVRL